MHIQGLIVVGDDNHFGGIVLAPEVGRKESKKRPLQATAIGVAEVADLICVDKKRTRRLSCVSINFTHIKEEKP